MFCYQENTHFSQAAPCSREKFWGEIRKTSTAWKIDSRREILEAVEKHDKKVIKKWLKNEDYGKFIAKKRGLKKEAAKKKFFEKSDEEKLLAFAQELKDNLTAFIFSCREFDEVATANGKPFAHRRLADCHLNGLVMLDIDHVDNPLEVFEAWKAKDELVKRTALVHITSSKKGIRFVFTANMEDGNLADQQIVYSQALGFVCDQSTIDATRNSFAPKEEDILYINEELLFDYYDEDFDREYTPQYREKKTQPIYHKFDTDTDVASAKTDAVAPGVAQPRADESGSVDHETIQIKWRGYDVQSIIDQRYCDKRPCAEDSNRHTESLKLATDLLLMLDGDKARVQRQTVSSAAECVAQKEKKYAGSLPSKAMLEAVQKVTGKTYQEIVKGVGQSTTHLMDDDMARWLWDWGAQIEDLMDDFPLLRDICENLKRNQYPAALFVGGGFLMTLMTRCTYRFYHRRQELRRLNNSTLIIGDPASGKSFATRLFNLLAAPIVAADQVGIEAINAYREQMRTKGANKEKPKKPKVVVRVHPARTSNAQFIQDMVNAVEEVDGEPMQLHMLTFDTELDNTLSVQKGGSWIDKMSLELKAFHNEEDGQAYSNIDSTLQNFKVFWNYIYTGTPNALKKKVNEQNFGSGLATRLTCVPLPPTDFQMMEWEEDDSYEGDEHLKEWATKLDRMKGEITMMKLVRELFDWTARRMEDAKENNSKADEMLLKRCAYHGFNFAAPFIVMRHWDKVRQEGEFFCGEFETDEVDWKLAELIVNIQYACQRYYFGAMAEAYFDNKMRDASVNLQRKQKTFEGFARLPEEFTNEDVMRCFNLSSEGAARMKIKRLLSDHLIEKLGDARQSGTSKSSYRKSGTLML